MSGPYSPHSGSRPGEQPQWGTGHQVQRLSQDAQPAGRTWFPEGILRLARLGLACARRRQRRARQPADRLASLAFRILAPAAGVVGIVGTLLALNNFWDKASVVAGDDGVFRHSTAGLYLTLIGFLIGGVAGVFGPRRA